jgi:hypothetical protein
VSIGKQLLISALILGTVQILSKIGFIKGFLTTNIIELLHGFFIAYLLFIFYKSVRTSNGFIKLTLVALLIFPLCFLFHLLPHIEKEILVIYPVIVITLIQLFGEHVGLKIVRPRNQDTPNQEA